MTNKKAAAKATTEILTLRVRMTLQRMGGRQKGIPFGNEKQKRAGSKAGWLVLRQQEHGFVEIFGLGEDGVFEEGLVGDEGVERGDAADGSVERVYE